MTPRRFEDGTEACDRFERRLDEGVVRDVPAEWRAHVAGCDRCTRALAAALAVEALVDDVRAAAPPGFTDAVMRRVAEAPRVAWSWAAALEDPLPWWVRVAAQPSTVLAAGVAALLTWKWAALLDAAHAAQAAVAAWTSAGEAAVGATPIGGAAALAGTAVAGTATAFATLAHAWEAAGPAPQTALGVGLLPALLWASWELVRWAEGLAELRRDPTLH